jgi:5-methyltetrahydropteroyltriglutamate--homocysteine methyltransferase
MSSSPDPKTAPEPTGLQIASAGSYPRIGDGPELQLLRRATSALDRGERNTADILDLEDEMTRRAIIDQLKAGLEVITDGQIRWYDPISYVASKLDNIKIAGLQRYFDTNFYFRQPVITGPPKRNDALVAKDFSFARNALGHLSTPKHLAGKLSIKPVLTGPYTLAKFSVSSYTGNGVAGSLSSLEARALAYADALAAEIVALTQIGASLIQIDEPAIIKYPEDWKIFERALAPLIAARDKHAREGRRPELALYVYFHDSAQLYEKLVALDVDVIGLDFTYNPKLVELVASAGSPKPLGLGLVNGRNTKLEDVGEVARQVERLLPKIHGGRAYLNASSGLEYLPRDRACAKLELLAKIRAAVAA